MSTILVYFYLWFMVIFLTKQSIAVADSIPLAVNTCKGITDVCRNFDLSLFCIYFQALDAKLFSH